MRAAAATAWLLGLALGTAACSDSAGSTAVGGLGSASTVSGAPLTSEPPPSSTPGAAAGASAGDWPTYHRSSDRAGSAPATPALDAATAHLDWTSAALDGLIRAEPLVDGGRVMVATEGGSLYGLDATTGKQLWRVHLSDAVTAALPCGGVTPMGVTGTPAVDPATHTVYAVTEKQDNEHLLVAVDDRSGEFLWQRVIDPPGSEPRYQEQDAALAVANGRVYVALGGRPGDCGAYHGWVIATGLDGGGPLLTYMVPSGRQAGISAASGIAVAADGSLLVATGNGASTGVYDHGNAVIRLDPGLQEQSYFAPTTWLELSRAGGDPGWAGPLLLPGGMAAVTGRDGRLLVLHADHLGGIGGQVSATALGGPAAGGMAASGRTLYVPCSDGLRAVDVDAAGATAPRWRGPVLGPPIVAAGAVWGVAPGAPPGPSPSPRPTSTPRSPTPAVEPLGARLVALDPAGGAELLAISVAGAVQLTTPAAAPGHIVVGAGDRVVAVAVS